MFSCSSKKLRRKALSENPALDDLLKFARATEKTNIQAEIIESKEGSINTAPGTGEILFLPMVNKPRHQN